MLSKESVWSEVSEIRITSSYTSQASRHAAESRNSSDVCFRYKQRSCLSRLPLWFTSWEKPQANLRHGSSNLFSTLEYCWRLLRRFLDWSEHRLSTAPRISSGITATSLTCTPGELRIGIVSNVPNKQQTSHCPFAFPASCRLGRQENSDRLKNTFHAPSPEPRANSEAHLALRRQPSTFTVSFQPKFRPPAIPPPPRPGVYCIALFCVAESCNSPPKQCGELQG